MTAPAQALTRLPGWEVRLRELIEARRTAAWAWGSFDCASFAFDAATALLGADPWKDIRGRWTSRSSAQATISALRGLPMVLSSRLGRPIRAAGAWRGDLGLVRAAEGLAVVVVMPEGLIGPLSSGGLNVVGREHCSVAWRVGHA